MRAQLVAVGAAKDELSNLYAAELVEQRNLCYVSPCSTHPPSKMIDDLFDRRSSNKVSTRHLLLPILTLATDWTDSARR